MKTKTLSILSILAIIIMLFVTTGIAEIPAPPVNQTLGMPDTVQNNLVEAECRACHQDGTLDGEDNPINPKSIPDRHHLLYGTSLIIGKCSVSKNDCLTDASCDASICEIYGNSCQSNLDCRTDLGETCGAICVGESAISVPTTNMGTCEVNPSIVCAVDSECPTTTVNTYATCAVFDVTFYCPDGSKCTTDEDCAIISSVEAATTCDSIKEYACLSCHEQDTTDGVINFIVQRDCLVCHTQVPGETSVHHLTGTAQGTDSPLGNPNMGDCTPCHGSIVDDFGDDAYIPAYTPSLATPAARDGQGLPLNSEGNGAGACNYCHSTGTGSTDVTGIDSATGVSVYSSRETHHSTGIMYTRTGAINNNSCNMCHGTFSTLNIRNCEQCHGLESLHSIQADSTATLNIGDIVVGEEDYGFGHIGANNPGAGSDCWGCHGFYMEADDVSIGATTPTINDSTKKVIIAETDTSITLSGSSFTNFSGTTEFKSVFLLTSQDGSPNFILTPEQIENSSATLIIPGTTLAGNYKLRAVKGKGYRWVMSNPVSISIKEPLVIDSHTNLTPSCGSIDCTDELLTITGSGFGDSPPAGTELYINVMQNNVPLNITTWTDTLITATGAVCDGSEITVNGLFGSATK